MNGAITSLQNIVSSFRRLNCRNYLNIIPKWSTATIFDASTLFGRLRHIECDIRKEFNRISNLHCDYDYSIEDEDHNNVTFAVSKCKIELKNP